MKGTMMSLAAGFQKLFQNKRFGNGLVVVFFVIYFLVGVLIFDDYGISTDEPYERQTMWVNIDYISTLLGRESMGAQELSTYDDKYYGSVMQMPAVVLEMGHEDTAYIYACRHFYTFGICMVGYIAFFILCKKLFKSNWLSLLGTMMVALYPRFFAEQFYNIKDMVFLSVFIVGMLATVELIESKFSWKWLIVFTFVSALATVTRMPGIILFLIVLGYMWLAFFLKKICGDFYQLTLRKLLGVTVLAIGTFAVFFVLLLPGLWENPIKNTIEFFVEFSDLTDGEGSIIFLGKDLNGLELPWYYIPLWIAISVPVWYVISFVLTGGVIVRKAVSAIKEKRDIITSLVFENKYWLWSLLLAVLPWSAMVAVGSTLYNAWRHCYFLLPPLIIFVLYGIHYLTKSRMRYGRIALVLLIAVGMISQIDWIGKNHPFEMVYFNRVSREYAEYFDRDYWHLSEIYAYKYIAEQDDSEQITVATSGSSLFRLMLPKEERQRLEFTEDAMYYIETYRGLVGNDIQKEGYEELHSIVVDGFKIATVYKKL